MLTDGVVSGAASVVLTEDVEECCDSVVGATISEEDAAAVSCEVGGGGFRTLIQSTRIAYVVTNSIYTHCIYVHNICDWICKNQT